MCVCVCVSAWLTCTLYPRLMPHCWHHLLGTCQEVIHCVSGVSEYLWEVGRVWGIGGGGEDVCGVGGGGEGVCGNLPVHHSILRQHSSSLQ